MRSFLAANFFSSRFECYLLASEKIGYKFIGGIGTICFRVRVTMLFVGKFFVTVPYLLPNVTLCHLLNHNSVIQSFYRLYISLNYVTK